MKKIKKMALLLLVVAAAGNSAMAQSHNQDNSRNPNRSYTLGGDAATGSGNITYQWYRDGQPISGATSADYILSADLAYGINVEFKRAVMSSTCPGEVTFSNIFYISFCGILAGTTCWASENVTAGNKFASRADEETHYFQWNRDKAWAPKGTVVGWNSTADNATTWSVNPCPTGWRLPTQAEFANLIEWYGGIWASHGSRGNSLPGRFFGYQYDQQYCKVGQNGCLFLPATGYRSSTDGGTTSSWSNGCYWSSTQSSSNGFSYFFTSASQDPATPNGKAQGLNIRCVMQ